MQRTMLYLSGIIFSLVAVAHIVRVLLEVEIVIDSWRLPLWISPVAALISVLLAYLCSRAATR